MPYPDYAVALYPGGCDQIPVLIKVEHLPVRSGGLDRVLASAFATSIVASVGPRLTWPP